MVTRVAVAATRETRRRKNEDNDGARARPRAVVASCIPNGFYPRILLHVPLICSTRYIRFYLYPISPPTRRHLLKFKFHRDPREDPRGSFCIVRMNFYKATHRSGINGCAIEPKTPLRRKYRTSWPPSMRLVHIRL